MFILLLINRASVVAWVWPANVSLSFMSVILYAPSVFNKLNENILSDTLLYESKTVCSAVAKVSSYHPFILLYRVVISLTIFSCDPPLDSIIAIRCFAGKFIFAPYFASYSLIAAVNFCSKVNPPAIGFLTTGSVTTGSGSVTTGSGSVTTGSGSVTTGSGSVTTGSGSVTIGSVELDGPPGSLMVGVGSIFAGCFPILFDIRLFIFACSCWKIWVSLNSALNLLSDAKKLSSNLVVCNSMPPVTSPRIPDTSGFAWLKRSNILPP